ncbi:MAG: rhombosortase [Comamonas sp.]
MRPRPGPFALWPCALALCLLMTVLQALPLSWRELLRYEVQAQALGQWWRMLTAHWVHLSWAHMAINACGLLLCCALADAMWTVRRLLTSMAVLGAMVSLLLWGISPQVNDYVGLSGVLYGLIVWMLLPPVLLHRDGMAAMVLLVVMGWLGWQSWVGPDLREQRLIGGYIVTQAHWYGVLGGILGALTGCSRQLRGRKLTQ